MFDPSTIGYEDITREHPERATWSHVWQDYRLLYRGGDEFKRAAGMGSAYNYSATSSTGAVAAMPGDRRPRRFLYQLEGEPDPKYQRRWERSFYVGYLPAIIDYFRYWLFSQPPVIRPAEGAEIPEWWESFARNADGSGKGLIEFIRDVFLDVLLVRRAGWMICTPDMHTATMSQAEAESYGLGGVVLKPFAAEEIVDWDTDPTGDLRWVVLCKESTVRDFPEERRRLRAFTILTREQWAVYECLEDGEEKHHLELLAEGTHGIGALPFVLVEVPHGMWVANKLAEWQKDIFNQVNMLSYGMLVSCFLQPYIKTNDEGAASRIFGEGLLLKLRTGGNGQEAEEFGWVSGNVDPLRFSAETLKEKRDEGYRIVHQMSLAVDSQAVGAIARSGTSKLEDRRASEIILAGFGGIVRDAIIKTANRISAILGDSITWECDGYDNFNVSSLQDEIETAALFQTFQIPSPTFKKTLLTALATGRILGHVDEETRSKIRGEIEEAIDQEEEAKLAPPELPEEMAADEESPIESFGDDPADDAIDIDQG